MKRKRKTAKGFTLGEVILSVAVMVVGILPIFAAMSGGLGATMKARDMIVASGLAQEGIELVKNVKDNNALLGSTPGSWLPAGSGPWNDCYIDYSDPILKNPGTGERISCGGPESGFALSLSSSTGLFSHSGGTGKFNRKIMLSYDASSGVVDGISVVYWGTNSGPSSMADARSGCLLSEQCIYTEAKLSAWE